MSLDLFRSIMGSFESFREWGPWALGGCFVFGIVLGNMVRSLRARLWLISCLILLPPLTLAALYAWGTSAACADVDCSKTVLAFVMVAAFAMFPICLGFGTMLGSMIAGIRRAIDRWVTPPSPHVSGAS